MTTLTSIMLEAAPVQPEGTGMSSILMIVALFVVFYFFAHYYFSFSEECYQL